MDELATKVRSAFYSGEYAFTGDPELISEITFLVREQYLSFEELTIGTMAEYRTYRDAPPYQYDEASGGSLEHVALKLLGGMFLKHVRAQSPRYEHPLCGYFPDIQSEDAKTVIECGHTSNADKILTYFKQGGINECILVPYPDPDDVQVQGYSFKKIGDLNGFLAALEASKKAALRTVLMKVSNKRRSW